MPNLEPREKEPGKQHNYRLDHPDFGDVYETTFARGVIRDFGIDKESPNDLILDDTCTVEVEEGEFKGVPFFYHCRNKPAPPPPPPPPEIPEEWKWAYDMIPSSAGAESEEDGASSLQENHSLKRGAWAFRVGDIVKVMLQQKRPVYVMGHLGRPSIGDDLPQAGAMPPQKCCNIFQIKTYDWSGFRFWGPSVKPQGKTQGFICSLRKTYGNFDENPLKDQYNKDLKLNFTEGDRGPDREGVFFPGRAYRLFGYREFQRGAMILFYGDWLIIVGPVMFIFQVKSIGMPGPTTANIDMLAAIYTPELEAAAKEMGRTKEALLNQLPVLGGGQPHFGPYFFENYKYWNLSGPRGSRFAKQRSFSNYLLGYYKRKGTGVQDAFGGDTPRWVYTEIFTEPVEAYNDLS